MEHETSHNDPPSDWAKSDLVVKNEIDNERKLLNLVTQETRFVLIQNIVAHPKEMPSLKELAYANPSKSKSTIRNHLTKLISSGVVETVELPKDERRRDLPHKFYCLTESGKTLLEKHELLRAKKTLKEMFLLLEKTERIEKYIDAPRPKYSDDKDSSDSDNSAQLIEP